MIFAGVESESVVVWQQGREVESERKGSEKRELHLI